MTKIYRKKKSKIKKQKLKKKPMYKLQLVLIGKKEHVYTARYFPLNGNHQQKWIINDSHECNLNLNHRYPTKFTTLGPCFFFDFERLSCSVDLSFLPLCVSPTMKSSSRSSPLTNLVTLGLSSNFVAEKKYIYVIRNSPAW